MSLGPTVESLFSFPGIDSVKGNGFSATSVIQEKEFFFSIRPLGFVSGVMMVSTDVKNSVLSECPECPELS